jgi:hypothetical protein
VHRRAGRTQADVRRGRDPVAPHRAPPVREYRQSDDLVSRGGRDDRLAERPPSLSELSILRTGSRIRAARRRRRDRKLASRPCLNRELARAAPDPPKPLQLSNQRSRRQRQTRLLHPSESAFEAVYWGNARCPRRRPCSRPPWSRSESRNGPWADETTACSPAAFQPHCARTALISAGVEYAAPPSCGTRARRPSYAPPALKSTVPMIAARGTPGRTPALSRSARVVTVMNGLWAAWPKSRGLSHDRNGRRDAFRDPGPERGLGAS